MLMCCVHGIWLSVLYTVGSPPSTLVEAAFLLGEKLELGQLGADLLLHAGPHQLQLPPGTLQAHLDLDVRAHVRRTFTLTLTTFFSSFNVGPHKVPDDLHKHPERAAVQDQHARPTVPLVLALPGVQTYIKYYKYIIQYNI